MATTAYDIIKRPIITEQSMEQTEMKRYTILGNGLSKHLILQHTNSRLHQSRGG